MSSLNRISKSPGSPIFRAACVLIFALLSVSFAPRAVQAQNMSAEQLERFQLRVSDGKRLFEMGKYRASIEQFEAARDIYDHSRLLFNIAQSYKAMGACAQAHDAFERFLAIPDIDDKIRARASELLEEVDTMCVEEGTLQIVCAPEDATLTLTLLDPDDTGYEPQSVACPLTSKIRVGHYEITAQADGFMPATQQAEVRRDETQNLRLNLEPEARFLDPDLEEILIYSTLGVGAATLLAGVISDYTAVSRLEELRAAQNSQDFRKVAELRDQADSASTRSAILYGVGAAFLAGGVTWKIIQITSRSEPDMRAQTSAPSLEPASAGARFSVDVGLNEISTRLEW